MEVLRELIATTFGQGLQVLGSRSRHSRAEMAELWPSPSKLLNELRTRRAEPTHPLREFESCPVRGTNYSRTENSRTKVLGSVTSGVLIGAYGELLDEGSMYGPASSVRGIDPVHSTRRPRRMPVKEQGSTLALLAPQMLMETCRHVKHTFALPFSLLCMPI